MTTGCKNEIFYGCTPESVPLVCLGTFEEEVYTSYTGPDCGLCSVEENDGVDVEVAGVKGWRKKDQKAYGICISLYDQHPINGKMSGDPIADAFAICARKNNAVLLIADGVNWGEKSRLAARCALYGCMTYIHDQVFTRDRQPNNTQEALKILRASLDHAHNTILDKGGGLTTVCACLICPVFKSNNYAVCCVNVGDSYAYVLSKNYGIREVTIGSHDVTSERDIRDAQGALGPVDGQNAELQNLTCSMTLCTPEDIVFLTTDGISDNFDPVVTKVAVPQVDAPKVDLTNGERTTNSDSYRQFGRSRSCPNPHLDDKPEMRPDERHIYAMKEMERVVHEFELITEENCSAQELCSAMVQHVLKLTDSKRKVLENPQLYVRRKMSSSDRKRRDSEIVEKMSKAPGKLDHASIVALELGGWLVDGSTDLTDTLTAETNENTLSSNNPNDAIKSPKPHKIKRSFFSPKSKHSTADSTAPKSHKNIPISLPIKNYFRRSSGSQSKSQPATPTTPISPPFPECPSAPTVRRRSLKVNPLNVIHRRSVSYESSV